MTAATVRAALVIATTGGVPGAVTLARVMTREPHLEEAEIGGLPATVASPAGLGPWPAVVVLNGATPLGNRHRAVGRLASSLARAGFLAVLPELPGLEEGEVGPRTAEATAVVAEAADSGVRFAVDDDGPGIPEGERERVFERFIQGSSAARGSGLGLAFCKLVIEQLGGRIWADASPLGGTRIAFELPPAPTEVPRSNQGGSQALESRVA